MKEKALIFHTDWTAELKDIKINDGKALIKYKEPIGDKEFIVDQCRPVILKGEGLFNKNHVLYMLKWDKLRPMNLTLKQTNEDDGFVEVGFKNNGNEVRETIVPFIPDFGVQTGEFKDITPDLLRQTYDLRFLKHMKKYASEEKKGISFGSGKGIMIALIGIIAFVLIFLFLYYS